MALGDNTNYLSDLINLGTDAQSNLYELTFTGGVFSSDSALTIRNAGITLPERKQGTHDVKYLTTSVTLPAASYEETKTATITFRLDQNYDVYRKLLNQQKKVYAPSLSYANPDPSTSNDTFTITVAAITDVSAKTKVDMYKLVNCYIKKVKLDTNFSYDSATPMTVSIDIWYQKRTDWAYETPTPATTPSSSATTPQVVGAGDGTIRA